MEETAENIVGEFRILERIKSGNQGTVCKAVCEGDSFPLCPRGTVVALKSMSVPSGSDALYETLRRRVETLMGIDHPNIVRYFGCFVARTGFSENHVVVQEFLEGESLAARLADSPGGLDSDVAFRVVKEMVAGLSAAVAHGIIHRDVKPANVFLCVDGGVKLIDFEVSRRTNGSVSTSSGALVGSFDYMAPEFVDTGFSGDEMSDVFSAGVVMHEVFTGQLPYQTPPKEAAKSSMTFFERWTRGAEGDAAAGSCRISYRVERVVSNAKQVMAKALSVPREGRFRSFAEFADALSRIRFRELKNGDTRYLILQFIGKGGFGEVFKARRRHTGQVVAIKHLLKPEYAKRFCREARIMAGLDDPCFVRFHDFIFVDRVGSADAFLVMDFLPGMPGNSLRDAIRRSAGNGLPFEDAMSAFARYAHGLAVMHASGIYHRDVKPSNLYYPEGHPEKAAIMDFGIARDENGTKTTGHVPGTLDYMPPETAFGESRGDSTMDIYALGLCLYEALTGKKGFPRLPSGNAAFAQFFRRASEKTPPSFDDERVVSRPDVLRLLRAMTDPDSSRRMSSAVEVEKSIVAIIEPSDPSAGEIGGLAQNPPRADGETTIATTGGSCESGDDEEVEKRNTGETVVAAPDQVEEVVRSVRQTSLQVAGSVAKRAGKPASRLRETSVRPLVVLKFAAAVVPLSVCGFLALPLIARWLSAPVSDMSGEGGRGSSLAADVEVYDFYGDDSMSVEEADALRDKWLAERRPPVLSREAYGRLVKKMEEMRSSRLMRDRLEVIYINAREVANAYAARGLEDGDARRDEWFRVWKDAPVNMLQRGRDIIEDARKKRLASNESTKLLPEAELEASAVSRSYAIDDMTVCDRKADAWRGKWSGPLGAAKGDYARLDAMMSEARRRRIAESNGALGGISLEALRAAVERNEPVEDRMNRLSEAETEIRSAVASGRLLGSAGDELLAEIERRREWTVFRVDNRSGLDISIGDVAMSNGTARVFVYTNAPPDGLAAVHDGYEPFPLGVQANGRNVCLYPEHFTQMRVSVSLPDVDDGVTCRVDGVPVRGGAVRLMPGSHECVYSRSDYIEQSMPFRVEAGESAMLPSPFRWRETPALAALASAEVAAEADDWNLVEHHLKFADVKGHEALRRRRELEERAAKRRGFMPRIDAAAGAYMDGDWKKVVMLYSALASDGCRLGREDEERFRTAVGNCRSDLSIRRRSAEMRGAEKELAKIDADEAKLDSAVKAVLGENAMK